MKELESTLEINSFHLRGLAQRLVEIVSLLTKKQTESFALRAAIVLAAALEKAREDDRSAPNLTEVSGEIALFVPSRAFQRTVLARLFATGVPSSSETGKPEIFRGVLLDPCSKK